MFRPIHTSRGNPPYTDKNYFNLPYTTAMLKYGNRDWFQLSSLGLWNTMIVARDLELVK
jgi:hypothetical protein